MINDSFGASIGAVKGQNESPSPDSVYKQHSSVLAAIENQLSRNNFIVSALDENNNAN